MQLVDGDLVSRRPELPLPLAGEETVVAERVVQRRLDRQKGASRGRAEGDQLRNRSYRTRRNGNRLLKYLSSRQVLDDRRGREAFHDIRKVRSRCADFS